MRSFLRGWEAANPWATTQDVSSWAWHLRESFRSFASYGLILPFFFIFNFLILMGPMLLMGITQIHGFEPGDADWGVRLEDVRGQKEAKEEVRRIVSLWQSGQQFEAAGGKRERGLLFLGAPGTGKTMLAKAIATDFNCPFISIPGSGFAQTLHGDGRDHRPLPRAQGQEARGEMGRSVHHLHRRDRRRRTAPIGRRRVDGATVSRGLPLLRAVRRAQSERRHDPRDARLARPALRARAPEPRPPSFLRRIFNQGIAGGMMGGGGGQLALNQLLIVMDGVDNPPFFRRVFTSKINQILDALYIVPVRVRGRSLRLRKPKPRKDQIYFIGATNVPIDALDPALTRPGRMGRHVWFRTPTKQDRLDIFELYIKKVAHAEELDRPERRDEIARITSGYSPAMIEQVCSLALTYAHHEGSAVFEWPHLVEAMVTLESGHGGRHRLRAGRDARRRPSTRPATPSPVTCT